MHPDKLGLYVSIPFCKFKCTYCNFASGVFPQAELNRYLAALEREVGEFSGAADTVYFGGGTPSLLSPEQWDRLMGALRQRFDIAGDAEITLEAAPGGFDDARITAWASSGVNRASLGVQSFVERELRAVGRPHTAEGVAQDLERLRAAGITDIGVDLIAGLPHQTAASWEESLNWVGRLSPTHISVYILEIDEDSRLGAESLAGGQRYSAGQLPGEDATADFYTYAQQRLAELGFHQYEISNFAKPGYESRHNRKYWDCRPYIGFGVDAHSFDGIERRGNVESIEDYMVRMERGESPVATREPVDERRRAEERLFLGLRQTAGVVLAAADSERYGGEITHLAASGLVEFSHGRLRLTPRGLLLSNEVFEKFV